jgi:hypothetical protein
MVSVCAVARGSVWERVARVKSSKRSRPADAPRGAHTAGYTVDESDQRSIDRVRRSRAARSAERVLRSDRTPPAADLNGPRIAIVRQRV